MSNDKHIKAEAIGLSLMYSKRKLQDMLEEARFYQLIRDIQIIKLALEMVKQCLIKVIKLK